VPLENANTKKNKPKSVFSLPQRSSVTRRSRSFFNKRLEKILDKVFANADTNADGSITSSETYDLVLKVYIIINRKAPIPPPTREKVHHLFMQADLDHNGHLGKDEFKRLVLVLLSRASTRLIAYQAASIFGGPLLAWEVVRKLKGNSFLKQAGSKLVPHKYARIVLNEEFWLTTLTVVFVATLGRIFLVVVSFIFDVLALKTDKGVKQDANFLDG